jgi:oligopeptide transport system substrate-binding protein
MTKWTHNSVIEMEKSTNYWDAKNVVLKKVVFSLIDDQNTALTMWESDQIDLDNGPPVQAMDRLKKENKLTTLPYLGTYYYSFQVNKKPFDDARVRKAFAMAIDRKAIITQILKAGQQPAYAYVCPGIPDADPTKDFRAVGGDYFKEDYEAAKKLLADAGYPDLKKFPAFEILYNTSASHKAIAEAIQEMWSKNLGLPKEKVKLHVEEWKVYLPTRQDTHDFQVARAGWIGDYVDPMTFLDMYVTKGGNNDTTYSNPKYDELINTAKMSGDAKVRMQAMHDAEKILMDDMVVAPIYFYVNNWLIKPYVKGLAINTIGGVDFKFTWIAKH